MEEFHENDAVVAVIPLDGSSVVLVGTLIPLSEEKPIVEGKVHFREFATKRDFVVNKDDIFDFDVHLPFIAADKSPLTFSAIKLANHRLSLQILQRADALEHELLFSRRRKYPENWTLATVTTDLIEAMLISNPKRPTKLLEDYQIRSQTSRAATYLTIAPSYPEEVLKFPQIGFCLNETVIFIIHRIIFIGKIETGPVDDVICVSDAFTGLRFKINQYRTMKLEYFLNLNLPKIVIPETTRGRGTSILKNQMKSFTQYVKSVMRHEEDHCGLVYSSDMCFFNKDEEYLNAIDINEPEIEDKQVLPVHSTVAMDVLNDSPSTSSAEPSAGPSAGPAPRAPASQRMESDVSTVSEATDSTVPRRGKRRKRDEAAADVFVSGEEQQGMAMDPVIHFSPTDTSLLKCSYCKHNSSSLYEAGFHMALHRNITAQPFVCPFDGIVFKLELDYESHMLLHYMDKESSEAAYFNCPYCHDLVDPAQRKDHVEGRHGKVVCPFCDKILANNNSYNNHKSLYHSAAKELPKELKDLTQLERRQYVPCKYCAKEKKSVYVKNGTLLRVHYLEEHPQVDDEFACTYCATRFFSHRSLRGHELSCKLMTLYVENKVEYFDEILKKVFTNQHSIKRGQALQLLAQRASESPDDLPALDTMVITSCPIDAVAHIQEKIQQVLNVQPESLSTFVQNEIFSCLPDTVLTTSGKDAVLKSYCHDSALMCSVLALITNRCIEEELHPYNEEKCLPSAMNELLLSTLVVNQ